MLADRATVSMTVPPQQRDRDGDSTVPPPRPPLRVRVEAVQTVTPWKAVAEGRAPRRIVAASRDAEVSALRGRIRILMFYDKPLEDGNGWKLAGKFKESLNIALSEEPVVAGRLRRRAVDDKGDDVVGYVVKYTDSGVRLAQARVEGGMVEFVKAAAGGVTEVQRLLTYWKEVDERDIEYSPLFFVQLTVFEGEGFAVGINASLLMSDPLLVANFLRTWSRIHNRMQTNGAFLEQSIFHLGNFRRADAPPSFIDDLVTPSLKTSCPHQTLLVRRQNTETPSGEDGQKEPSSLASILASRLSGNDVDTGSIYLFDNGPDGAHLKVGGACGSDQFLDNKSATLGTCLFMPVSTEQGLGGFQDVAFEDCRPIHFSFALDSGGPREVIAVLGGAAGAGDDARAVPAAATLLSFTAPVPFLEAVAKA